MAKDDIEVGVAQAVLLDELGVSVGEGAAGVDGFGGKHHGQKLTLMSQDSLHGGIMEKVSDPVVGSDVKIERTHNKIDNFGAAEAFGKVVDGLGSGLLSIHSLITSEITRRARHPKDRVRVLPPMF